MVKQIGTDDCPIASVCNALRQTKALRLSPTQWRNVAKDIIGEDEAEEISDCIEYAGYSLYKAFATLLEKWVKKIDTEATLEKFIFFLDQHKLFDSADQIRKRFRCKPRPIREIASTFQHHDLTKEQESYILRNFAGLADDIKVTDKLLLELKKKKVIQTNELSELDDLKVEDKSLALCNKLINTNVDLCNFIEALETDEQFGPSWILRDFYTWASENLSSLKTMSSSQKRQLSLPDLQFNDLLQYFPSTSKFIEGPLSRSETSGSQTSLTDIKGFQPLPIRSN